MVKKDFTDEQMKRYFSERSLVGTTMLFIFGIILIVVPFAINYPILALIGLLLCLVGGVSIAVGGGSKPTDAQYDKWLEEQSEDMIANALKKLRLDKSQIPGRPLIAHSVVLPGTRDASRYQPGEVQTKKGKDGVWRYSVNLYTFFFPAQHYIAVFTTEISALRQSAHIHSTSEYFYRDIVGVTTGNMQDTVELDRQKYQYLIETFSLEIGHGGTIGIGASISATPIDKKQKAPVFTISGSDVDQTVASLRMLLRSKKQGNP